MDAARFAALLMVDVVESTALAQRLGDAVAAALWTAHDRLARDLLAEWRGREIDKTDGFLLLFDSVVDAVGYALAYHRAIATLPVPLHARAGVHAGSVLLRENDAADVARGAKPLEVEGIAKPTTARVAALAQAGQTLITGEACAAWPQPAGPLRSLGHWRLKGVAAPIELFEVGDDAASFPALRDLPTAWRVALRGGAWVPMRDVEHNLPQPMTSFVGRQRELADIEQRLDHTRLLTLVGTGGLGKTRLALEAAQTLLGKFEDGAWFVDFAAVSDPEQLPQAVASALRLADTPGRSVLDTLLDRLQARRLLLVLDNCEHLVEAAAALARRVLERAPAVSVLATSRELLRIPGETILVLAPLELPATGDAADLKAIGQCEAVRLFVDRARLARPGFELKAAAAPAAAEICRRLDAIPLAIELAAARLRSLSLAHVAQRLDDRFRLLTGGDRTALPRQQTLRALIDWSHELLTEPERVLFRRLAVFAGGCTLDAAEAIGAAPPIARDDVPELLSRLVERSLVSMESGGQRYRLLESMRAYALEHLERAGEGASTRDRHLAHHLGLARAASKELWGADQKTWIARLDAEREDIFAAHRWCDNAPEGAAMGLKLVAGLQLYWMPGGLLELGYRLTLEALARPHAQVRDEARCGALYAASQLAYFSRRLEAAIEHAQASLAIAREMELNGRAIDALLMHGYAAADLGRAQEAQRRYEEAIALARDSGDRARLSYALNGFAGNTMNEDPAASIAPFEESAELAREVGDEDSLAVTLGNLARCLMRSGRLLESGSRLAESLRIAVRIGAARPTLLALDACAALAAAAGDGAFAARFDGAADAQWRRIKVGRAIDETAQAECTRARALELIGADALAAGRAEGERLALEAATAEMEAWLARHQASRATAIYMGISHM